MSTAKVIILIGAAFWLLTCIAVFDIARKDFGGLEKKVSWGFVCLVPFIGPLIYFLFGARRGKHKPNNS